MSIFPEQPFDEREERYFLAEILKDSQISSATLLRVIHGERIQPRWTEIALPHGRSVAACQKAFDSLFARVFRFPLQPLGPAPLPSPSPRPKKRPAAGAENPMGPNRELQPRGPGFATVNDPPESTAYPAGLADPGDQRKKKRGRPSKAEAEIKAAEYAARGEPYPPPRKPKNPKLSSEGASTTGTMGPSIMFTPVTMGPGVTEGASSGKKRAAKPNLQQESTIPNFSETPANPQQIYEGGASILGQPMLFGQAPQPGNINTGVRPGEEQLKEEDSSGQSRQAKSEKASPPENVALRERKASPHQNEVNDAAGGPIQQQATTEYAPSEAMLEGK
ncbi:MAG: hypothetical protein LQ349_007456 [Xanthoria aureola]|nr:MAG: hypothetical protein LQ349_007456 [Xanthoria aureola]